VKLSAKLILVKNAASNVMRGTATALIAVVMPPFLTRLMTPAAFGAWALILQLGAYLAYLDLGIQTTVGRFVAFDTERKNLEHRNQVVSTSAALLTFICAAGLAGIWVLSHFLNRIFPQVPSALSTEFVIATVIVAVAIGIGLPFGLFNAIFVGLEKNEVPAFIVGGSRLISAIVVIILARQGGNLETMAAGMALVFIGSYILQFWVFRRQPHGIQIAARYISRRVGRELLSYCGSLTIWTVAMLLINGLDLTLVGTFQFSALAYYAVAASLVTFIAGMQNAVFTAMIAPAAALHARGDTEKLGRTMVAATRYGTFLLLMTGVPLIWLAHPILSLWVGSTYASAGTRLLQVLVVANVLRLTATPYVVVLIATGQQRLVTVTPLIEGASNLVASIAGGLLYGAIGVAVGTLIGSAI
jgi:O-antigen/teichoic acid export membrane protein